MRFVSMRPAMAAALILVLARSLSAQDMPGMSHAGHEMHNPMLGPLGISMDRMGSGTTWIPDAVRVPSAEVMLGQWHVLAHGFLFAQYDRQFGVRGGEQFGSLNWAMLMASRPLAGGRIQARTMLSLDAATVGARGYPLLLQTGETYKGEPLHDIQHPHDFFMEVGALYEREISQSLAISLYAAPSGEPALNPVAFMHRPSAMDDPAAPIGHHWVDATHITFGVLSAGVFSRTWKLEGSVFNGRAPDENRWNFDRMRLDSWSARLSVNPDSNWSASVGYGFLKSPEALAPEESAERITLGVMHGASRPNGQWATSLIAGANRHEGEARWTTAFLLESELILNARNTFFGRAETARKSGADLVLPQAGPENFDPHDIFPVSQLSLGYIRELWMTGGSTLGLGMRATVNFVPSELVDVYGTQNPVGTFVFLRYRPR